MKKLIALIAVLLVATTAQASFIISDVSNEDTTIRTVKEIEAYFNNGTEVTFVEITKTYINGDTDPVGVSKKWKYFKYGEETFSSCLSSCNYDAAAIETFARTIDFDAVSE